MSEFGDYIRQMRERKNLSLSQAGALIGCTKAHLWELEKGRHWNPGLVLLTGMARAYDAPLAHLAEAASRSIPHAKKE